MKFGQLTEHNMKICLEKLNTKYGGGASPRTFYEQSKLYISLVFIVFESENLPK